MYGSHIRALGVSPPLPPRDGSSVICCCIGSELREPGDSVLDLAKEHRDYECASPCTQLQEVLRIFSQALYSVIPSAPQILFLDIVSWGPEAGLELLMLLSLAPKC